MMKTNLPARPALSPRSSVVCAESDRREASGVLAGAPVSLPRMGRPSESGLSIKRLGSAAYHRALWRLRHPQGHAKRWTGLSPKQMGQTEYVRAWRRLRAAKAGPGNKLKLELQPLKNYDR